MKIESVIDFNKRRQEKIDAQNTKEVNNASKALAEVKSDLTDAINIAIDHLVVAGMSENKASGVVMTYLSDLIMGHDIDK